MRWVLLCRRSIILIVLAGLVPAIAGGTVPRPMAGAGPAMTMEASRMALYEMRTYTLYVGKMAEAVKLYQELGFPALQKGGHDRKLVG